MDIRINETRQIGAVRKPHLPGNESVYLFLKVTINASTQLDLSLTLLVGFKTHDSSLNGSSHPSFSY